MEGPSLFLTAELLSPLINSKILEVEGNTKFEKERLVNKKILDVFSYGKYLFFQFDTFALRIHFLLWGTIQATVNGIKVTGDYPRKERPARLVLKMKKDEVYLYTCSIKGIENNNAKNECDYSIDTISSCWDEKQALKKLKNLPKTEQIADALLDQSIFLGVGNIIKNEVLFLAKIRPKTPFNEISQKKLKEIVRLVRTYVFQFYEWRKTFTLRKHYQIYKQKTCKCCGNPVLKEKTGLRQRFSYSCLHCQK